VEPLDPELRDAYRFFRSRGYAAQEANNLVERERAVRAAVAVGFRVRWVDQGDGLRTVRLEHVLDCECGRQNVRVLDELCDAYAESADSRREYEAMLSP
jgi:hypothetical protein